MLTRAGTRRPEPRVRWNCPEMELSCDAAPAEGTMAARVARCRSRRRSGTASNAKLDRMEFSGKAEDAQFLTSLAWRAGVLSAGRGAVVEGTRSGSNFSVGPGALPTAALLRRPDLGPLCCGDGSTSTLFCFLQKEKINCTHKQNAELCLTSLQTSKCETTYCRCNCFTCRSVLQLWQDKFHTNP